RLAVCPLHRTPMAGAAVVERMEDNKESTAEAFGRMTRFGWTLWPAPPDVVPVNSPSLIASLNSLESTSEPSDPFHRSASPSSDMTPAMSVTITAMAPKMIIHVG